MTRHPSISRAILLLGMPLLPGALLAQSPEDRGRVVGTVVDSTTFTPLSGARVFLWETSHQGISDDQGRFSVDSVPPGRYSVVFFHERLGQLGISAGPAQVRVEAGRTVGVELAIPSAHTLHAAWCAAEPGDGGVVVGRVTDGVSDTPLPSVRVRFAWQGVEGEPEGTAETRTDGDGWYRVCDLPRGVRVAVTATFLDRVAPRRQITPAGTPVHLDIPVSRLEMTELSGQLVDAETGEGIGDATAALAGTGFQAVTGGDGRFRFNQLLPGEYTLRVDHLAYGSRQDPLEVTAGGEVRVRVALSQRAIELPPLTVTVEAERLQDRAMGGTVISSQELDRVRSRSRDALDLIQNQAIAGLVTRRQGGSLCVGFLPGQSRMFRTGCVPAVLFIDNVRVADPRQAMDLPAEVVDRIVLYRPIEAGNLFGLGGGNGVVMIFTKH